MPKIINFEGLHGSGKTTQAKLLEFRLKSNGFNVEYICSADKPLSKYGMNFLKDCGTQTPETLFFLSLANNAAIQDRIKNYSGDIIILDRYIYTDIASTLAAKKDRNWIYDCLTPFILPDIAFLIDITSEEALQRKNGISSKLEKGYYQNTKTDNNFLEYQNMIKNAYSQICSYDKNLIKIDGSMNIQNIHSQILSHLEKIL